MGHTYTVELRLYGELLDPDAITRETGLQPCQIRLAGSRDGVRTFPKGMWAFNGAHPGDWDSFGSGDREKIAAMAWERIAENRIREAIQAGAFDDLRKRA